MNLPPEIWQIILEKSDFCSQIRLTQVSQLNHCFLRITDFYNIDKKYLMRLTDNILKSYPYIKILDASNNPKITNVNYLSKLEILYATLNCGINNTGIQNINLIKLYASFNYKITDVKHMTKLIECILATRNIVDAQDHLGTRDDIGARGGIGPIGVIFTKRHGKYSKKN